MVILSTNTDVSNTVYVDSYRGRRTVLTGGTEYSRMEAKLLEMFSI